VSFDGAARLGVVVREGQVMVAQPDGHVRMVRAGQSLHFGPEFDAEGALTPPSAEETALLEDTLRTAPDAVEPPSGPSLSITPSSPPTPSSSATRPHGEPLPDEATIRQWLLAGDTARAERALIARLAVAPRESSSWWLLGETRRRAGQPGEAVTAYQRVIELGGPGEANRARFQVALLLEERLGDTAGAIQLYRAYLAGTARPLEAAAQLRLGRLLSEAEQASRLLGSLE
jgi:hypothetical protein